MRSLAGFEGDFRLMVILILIAVSLVGLNRPALGVTDPANQVGVATTSSPVSPVSGPSGQVLINFEVYPDATIVVDGSEITSQYASWGVIFDSIRAPSATQITNVIDFLPTPSGPNFLLPGGPAPFNGGTLILEFLAPVTEVGSFFVDDQFPVEVSAYDSGGTLVGTALSDGSNVGFDSWGISYGPGITRVEMAGGYFGFPDSPDGWGIDDLAFTPIPEPSSLFLGTLGGLAALRRRRRQDLYA